MKENAKPRTYTKVARAQTQERTRESLLDAAGRAFFSGRWDEVSLAEMAVEAGVTKQTLLRHFGSKAGLLEQAAGRGFRIVREQRWTTPTDDLGGAVDNLLDHYEQTGERALKLATNASDALLEIGHAARQLHYDWVDHAFGAWLDRLSGEPPERVRAALIAVCDVQAWWLLSHDLGLARRDVRATLLLMIERLLEEDT